MVESIQGWARLCGPSYYAPEWDGSLSGARVREAVSWGKVRSKARRITVEGDATVLLPLIFGPLL